MLNFLRKIRKSYLLNNKAKSYLLYALGEIILVMAGILLALYVNNLNEASKQNRQLRNIFETVRADLLTDTLGATEIVSFYDSINKYSRKVINKEYNASTIDNCNWCKSLITVYKPYTIQDKGYNMLKNFGKIDAEEQDSLQTTILQFYKSITDIIDQSNEFVKSETLSNLDYFANQPWFIDWMQGRLTNEMKTYFGNSEAFKNRVAKNYILATQNHANFINTHKRGAREIIKSIDSRLKFDD
jgi:hypothetical protein